MVATRDELPVKTCPCCTDRLAGGALFKFKTARISELTSASLEACGECLDAVSDVDGAALLEEVLSASPVRLRWDLSIAQVEALAGAMVERSKAAVDAVVAAHASGAPLTWLTVGAPLCEEDAEFGLVDSSCTFPGHVSTDKALRDACTAVNTSLSAYAVASNSRKDLYRALLAYAETVGTQAARTLASRVTRPISR